MDDMLLASQIHALARELKSKVVKQNSSMQERQNTKNRLQYAFLQLIKSFLQYWMRAAIPNRAVLISLVPKTGLSKMVTLWYISLTVSFLHIAINPSMSFVHICSLFFHPNVQEKKPSTRPQSRGQGLTEMHQARVVAHGLGELLADIASAKAVALGALAIAGSLEHLKLPPSSCHLTYSW